MVLGFCFSCKKTVNMENYSEYLTSNNRRIMKGLCPFCKSKVNKFLAGTK